MKRSILFYILLTFFVVSCKKHFTKGAIRVFDGETGEGLQGVSVTFNHTAFDRDLARTDANGEIEISGIGNLYDTEVNVFVPKGYSSRDAWEKCYSQSVYTFEEKVLEIPLYTANIVKVNLKRSDSFEEIEKSFYINFLDTHCASPAYVGSGAEIYWNGRNGFTHLGDVIRYSTVGVAEPSVYAKRCDIYSPASKAEYVGAHDTTIYPDTSFYISPPFDQDTIEMDLWFD